MPEYWCACPSANATLPGWCGRQGQPRARSGHDCERSIEVCDALAAAQRELACAGRLRGRRTTSAAPARSRSRSCRPSCGGWQRCARRPHSATAQGSNGGGRGNAGQRRSGRDEAGPDTGPGRRDAGDRVGNRRRRRPARRCCTASPVAARPRSTCAPRERVAGERPAGAGAGSRDQPYAAADRALRAALRRSPHRLAAQRTDAGAAAAQLARRASRLGRPGARHAPGGLCVDAAARPDRRRRGARPFLQAAGRCALLGARSGGLARPARERVP